VSSAEQCGPAGSHTVPYSYKTAEWRPWHLDEEVEAMATLNFSRTKKMAEFDADEPRHLAAKGTARHRHRRRNRPAISTGVEAKKRHLPLAVTVAEAVDGHAPSVPLYGELG
jgi:serine/threonine-protein kinase HipA